MNAYLWNYFYALISTAVGIFLLGGFVLLKAPKRFINKIFSLWLFAVFGWSFFQAWMGVSDNETAARFFARTEHIGIIAIPVLYLHFVLAFLGLNKIPKEALWLRLNYAISLFFILSIPFPYFIKGVDPSGPLRFAFEPGPLYFYSFIWFACVVIHATHKLLRASIYAQGKLRVHARYLFWASLIAYSGGTPNYLYVFDRSLPIINPFFTYGVLILVPIITYCIIKHRLFDIEISLRNTVIYGLVYSLALGIFSFFVIFFGQWMVYGAIDRRVIWMCMVTLLMVTAIVSPLDAFLSRLTDRILFKKKYEYQKTLKEISSGMVSVRDLNKLSGLIVNIIAQHVRVNHASIFLLNNKNPEFHLFASRGKFKIAGPLILPENNLIVKWLNEKKEPLAVDDLNFLSKDGKLEELIKQLEELKTNLSIPCFFEDKLIGFLLLGKKLSGEIYTQEDINVFMTLANHAASSIENCWAYDELKEKDKQLIETEKLAAIGRLASNIAHEIKNPLAPIKTYTEFLDEKIDDPKFRADFKKVILEEVNRINHIVEELIDYARPKKVNKIATDIRQVVEGTLHLLENELSKQKITFIQEYNLNSHVLFVDPEQLKQVFLNLFLNSIRALESIVDRPRQLKIKTHLDKDSLTIKIQDNGCGIKKENIPFIFDPFFSTKENGSGLGLSIVQSLIKNHGGTLSVESEIGRGTTFNINLPK